MTRGGVVGALVLAGVVAPASAATYTVRHLVDSWAIGDGCSLREAIAAHNALGGGNNECGVFDSVEDKIVFAKGVTGILPLNPGLGELVLNAPSVSIQGPGASRLAISGAKEMSVLVLAASAPPQVTIRGLTLRDGFGRADATGWNARGGGIRVEYDPALPWAPPSLLIEDAALFNNTCELVGNSWGAAIRSYGNLVIRRTKVTANRSDFGIISHEGTLTIEDSEFADNATNFVTGAIWLAAQGAWAVRRTLFQKNTVVSNGFTAISAVGSGVGVIENSTFVSNSSGTGGVIESQVPLTIRNSTFYANIATWVPGQAVIVAEASTLTLSSNLFGKHEYPDLLEYLPGGAQVTSAKNLFNTTAALLPAGTVCAASTAGGANLCGVTVAGVGSLANHGGPTATLSLLPGSPALDAGENLGGLATDQRGAGFSRIVGVAADIGAYEYP